MSNKDYEEDDGTWSCPPVEEGDWPVGINQRASYRWIDPTKYTGDGSEFLRANGTWFKPLTPSVGEVVKEANPPGTVATLAFGAAAVAAKNPVVSRRFWRRK